MGWFRSARRAVRGLSRGRDDGRFDLGMMEAGIIRMLDLDNSEELRQAIEGDTTISRQSKDEFLGLLQELPPMDTLEDIDGLRAVEAMFKEAQEGINAKYKARQVTEQYYKTVFDQPGESQFMLSGRSNNSILGGL